jgi:hypothetical protein
MALQFVIPVFTRVRKLRLPAVFLLLFTFVPAWALGQDPSSTSPHSLILKPEPRKVWTEDDLAGLLKPWDLYRIAQEKKSALAAAVPVMQEIPVSSNLAAAAPVVQEIPASSNNAVLRAMDTRQFHRFLKMLDTDVATWQARLKSIDVFRLEVEYEEQEEIERRYDSCQEALERIRDEVTKLSQDQTLKLDLLLLIDLNALARNLDGLSVNLASPFTAQGRSAAQKSLGWAKEVLGIDEELAPRITEFQYHALALAGVWEAAPEVAQQAVGQAK